MRNLFTGIILFTTLNSPGIYAQGLQENTCNSKILSKQEFEKCKVDSIWNKDLIIATNYISQLKTALLPQYRTLRKNLAIPTPLQKSIQILKSNYDSTLNHKMNIYANDMDKNQKFVQPKAYLTSLLSLQTFRFYPDVYAILLDQIHLVLNPKTSLEKINYFNNLVENIYQSIPPTLFHDLELIISSFAIEMNKLKKEGFSPMFQGIQSEEELKKNRMVNFLLWSNE